VLSNSQFLLVFIFFWIFVTSLLTFAFLVAVFFSKAKLAGIVGPIILFAAVMPRYAFFSTDGGEMLGAKTMTSVFSPTAFTFGADLLMQYEGANLGMSWSNVSSDDFSFARVLTMMLFDFVLYAVLAWYLEHVLPNEVSYIPLLHSLDSL
jgi:ATP-binding cassette subfamily A (ABC1) protein 3